MSDGEEEKKKKFNSAAQVVNVPPSSSSTDAGDPSLLQIPTFGRMSTGILPETEDEKKQRQQQHKKRSKNWTRQETLRLIRLRSEFEPRFARSGRKSELWDEISVALQRESICRDAQQCRDKWEKLTAGYKEVRDGIKNRQDNPFFDELHPLLSARGAAAAAAKVKDGAEPAAAGVPNGGGSKTDEEDGDGEGEETEDGSPPGKRRCRYWTGTGTNDLDEMLENIFARQQKFFRELLDSMEQREQIREQIRQEKEDRWRAEERDQRGNLSNAMIILSRKLLQQQSQELTALNGVGGVVNMTNNNNNNNNNTNSGSGNPKKRSKNWKRAEVLRLIKFRGEMEIKFMKSSRRAALWEEVAELLAREGIRRDGKQCREKWDKLVAEYKEVVDGKRERGESPYFAELTPIVGRPSAEQQVHHHQQQQLQMETTLTN